MTKAVTAAVLGCGVLGVLGAGGCMDRTVTITSDPPGAVVWMNDAEVGRTPVTTAFTFYGKYDVRLRKDGYEPLVTSADLVAPIYEYPPLDLAAMAFPLRIRTERRWHFELQPQPPEDEERQESLIERARAMQEQAGR